MSHHNYNRFESYILHSANNYVPENSYDCLICDQLSQKNWYRNNSTLQRKIALNTNEIQSKGIMYYTPFLKWEHLNNCCSIGWMCLIIKGAYLYNATVIKHDWMVWEGWFLSTWPLWQFTADGIIILGIFMQDIFQIDVEDPLPQSSKVLVRWKESYMLVIYDNLAVLTAGAPKGTQSLCQHYIRPWGLC